MEVVGRKLEAWVICPFCNHDECMCLRWNTEDVYCSKCGGHFDIQISVENIQVNSYK